MRVLAIGTSYPKGPDDSTAPFVRSISHGLFDHGIEVHLLLPYHPDLDWPSGDPPVRLHTYPYVRRGWRRLHVWGYAGSLRSDVALRREALAILPLAAASSLVHLQRLASRVKPDLLHAHWLLPNAPLAAIVSKRTGIPLAISLHGSGAFMAERHRVLAPAARFALKQASAVTACSRDLASRVEALGASAESTFVIPYGVEVAAFQPASENQRSKARASLGAGPETFLILAVGRLVAKKGFEFLIRAMPNLLRDHESPLLIIAGAGDLGQELRELARSLDVSERVHFMGDIDRQRILELYQAADVLAVPSIHDAAGNVDGLPNVVLEGLASGLPLVASSIAGIPDVIRHEENGLLIPEQDPEALATALRRLASQPDLRLLLGQRGRRSAEESLNWGSITGRYAEVLRRAARGTTTA